MVHPADGLPDGQIHHAAGETEGGYLISVVWDSKEHADKFVTDVLLASMPVEGGFEGHPDERTAEISNLETACVSFDPHAGAAQRLRRYGNQIPACPAVSTRVG